MKSKVISIVALFIVCCVFFISCDSSSAPTVQTENVLDSVSKVEKDSLDQALNNYKYKERARGISNDSTESNCFTQRIEYPYDTQYHYVKKYKDGYMCVVSTYDDSTVVYVLLYYLEEDVDANENPYYYISSKHSVTYTKDNGVYNFATYGSIGIQWNCSVYGFGDCKVYEKKQTNISQ